MRGDWKVAFFVGLLVFLVLLLFHRNSFIGSDEIGIYEMTHSLCERGNLEVPNISNTFKVRNRGRHSQYAVGQAVLAVPFYQLGTLAERVLPKSWERALAGPGAYSENHHYQSIKIFTLLIYPFFISGILISVFFLFERQLGVSLKNSILTSLLLGFCTYNALMSTFFLRHTTEALLILASFFSFFLWKKEGKTHYLMWGCALASLTLLVRVGSVMACLGLAFYLASAFVSRRFMTWRRGDWTRVGVALVLPFSLVLIAHIWINLYRWGALFASPMMRHINYFDTPFRVGFFGNLFAPGMSIFLFSPLLLLFPWIIYRFLRQYLIEGVTILAIFTTFLIFYSKFTYWTGLWSAPGPRYLFATVPLLMLPLGLWLDQGVGRIKWILVGVLAAVGAFVQVVFMATNFGSLNSRMDYYSWTPGMDFVFLWNQAPVLHATKFFLKGEINDMWIVSFATGWPGQSPHPILALSLAVLWLCCVGFCLGFLWRKQKTQPTSSLLEGPPARQPW